MDLVTMLASVLVWPWLCLGFVIWMGRIEESLPNAVRKAERRPDPPPVLAMPVQRAADQTETSVKSGLSV